MHLKRWITGLTALPILIGLIWCGPPFMYSVFIAIVCVVALWEYFRIILPGSSPKDGVLALSLVIGPLIVLVSGKNSFSPVISLLTFNLLLTGMTAVFRFKSHPGITDLVAKQALGMIYIPLCLSYLLLIRNGDAGIAWTFFLLCTIFAGDTGAFYAGSYLGRHKLCPSVSPGKTIQGALGGLLANVIIGSIFKYFFLENLPWGPSLLFCISVGIAGQIGDLFESAFKRAADIKDSGSILPGHGGILDRIDALLFATPVAYFFKQYLL
jgi:phosphatidate cytidylyltransferase